MYPSKKNFSASFDFEVLEKNVIDNKVINYIKTDNCIGKYIKNGVYWEKWMFEYLKKYYKENTNILDLGANIGTTSLLMAEIISKNCKVYAFEPIYDDIFFKNILDNNLSDTIELFPYAAGNKLDHLQVHTFDFHRSENFGGFDIIHNLDKSKSKSKSKGKSKGNTKEITALTVDSFNFENVSLIKIDVENMEIEVLEGCYNLILKNKPSILIESYKLDVLKNTVIFKKLTDLGYTIKPIPEGYLDFLLSID